MHREMLAMMREVFGGSMINSVMPTSAEIDNAKFADEDRFRTRPRSHLA